MEFNKNNKITAIGEKLGYIFSYFLFTTILYIILNLLKKIPESWSYLNIMIITFIIALAGIIIRKILR